MLLNHHNSIMLRRLADYFVVVGFDHDKQRGGVSNGKILQRFPQKDWPETPFIESIEMFCQPQGWRLSGQLQKPSFFTFVLTDVDANKHYCACLSFHEPIDIQPTKHDVDEAIDEASITSMDGAISVCNGSSLQHHSIMYAPKCLVLVSRFNYKEALKNCLSIIYSVYIDNLQISLDTIIGNILACVEIPPFGGPQIRFSIGAGDRQALQPSLSATIPVTGTCVYELFENLGIESVVTLVCSAMTEHKILLYSRSYSRLNDACHALTSIMYPFVYNHIYIPLLPSPLIEVLSTPTPFIMGIHSSLKNEADLLDVIVVNLDGGSLSIPECHRVPHLDEPLHSQLITHLCHVIRPQLFQADDAFPTSHLTPSPPHILDKEIRAILIRTFAQLLQGYRSCLTITRIHPKPVITFHKAAFLGQRNLVESEFVVRLLECMFFNTFVQERGLPYRQCDLFDELYSSMQNILKEESKESSLFLKHIKELAKQLELNENPNQQPHISKILLPTEGSFTRIHIPPFPTINNDNVQELIDTEMIKREIPSQVSSPVSSIKPVNNIRIVPMGVPITALNDIFGTNVIVTNSARRLEVMRNCVNCIFENKILDAKKTFPAVLRALKNKAARLALTNELSLHVSGNKAVLEHQQFDLIVRLMNCALQDDSHLDVNGVASAILPLAITFCRKLCTGVYQFAYTMVQEHSVWSNIQFWEQTFYCDVEKEIKKLYLEVREKSLNQSQQSLQQHLIHGNSIEINDIDSIDSTIKSSNSSVNIEPSALELAAQQMRLKSQLDQNQLQEYICNEESTVYSQAIHFIYKMVYLKVPLDITIKNGQQQKTTKVNLHVNNEISETNSVSNCTVSNVNETSGSHESNNDNESGFEEENNQSLNSEIGTSVIKFITRFVDKVFTESGVTPEHLKQLHQMIPGVVAMQIDTLEAVLKESKHLPAPAKPKIISPNLLPGEDLTMHGLRVYLLPDGRDDDQLGGTMLPAEGAIFLTNYRIIFKGRPCDAFASESIVVRSFPIATLTKEKKINVHAVASIDHFLQEGLQLRSNTFQLIRIAFDDEVTSDNIEAFRKLINKERTPPNIFHLFAFTSQLAVSQSRLIHLHKNKEKSSTFKGIAKKTLLRTAQKAGFKSKTNRKHKYIIDSSGFMPSNVKSISPKKSSRSNSIDVIEDQKSSVNNASESLSTTLSSVTNPPPPILINHHNNDVRTLDKLQEMSYVRDYQRLGLGTIKDHYSFGSSQSKLIRSNTTKDIFRISTVNLNYSVSKSYPGLIVVPSMISDESIRKSSRCYRHGRFPSITWKHPKTKALLLRSSSFHGKSVFGMLKGQTTAAMTTTSSNNTHETTANIEQEKYINAIINSTPIHFLPNNIGSSLSINSVLGPREFNQLAPDSPRKMLTSINSNSNSNAFQRAMNTLRNSGGKGAEKFSRKMGKQLQKWSNSNVKQNQNPRPKTMIIQNDTSSTSSSGSQNNLNRMALYVFGEKTQIKGIKTESLTNCDFIPVEIHETREVKASFRKLMKACAPSAVNTDPSQSFYKQIENTEWLNQLQTIMQVSIAIVDVIDTQGSSVMLCLEDGWDLVPQIVSIAELCLDPYYRTFEGFRTLIEKEWLAFGHRFSHRSNHTAATLSTGFAPIFLQFLDVVHQILNQFPLSFEFNHYFLKFMAYHYASCRFRTFLLDNESERAEVGWISEDAKFSFSKHGDDVDSDEDDDALRTLPKATTNNTSGNTIQYNYIGTSFWEFVSKVWSKSSLFYNFYYVPIISQEAIHSEEAVLRPSASISSLKIWDYFVEEELCHGSSYDLEVISMELQRREVLEATDGSSNKTQRQLITSGYDSVVHMEPNCFTQLFNQIRNLEEELNYMPQKWFTIWDKTEIPLNTNVHVNYQ